MDPATVLKTGSEAVSLVGALAKLVKENKGKGPPQLSALLARLQIEAVQISSDIERKAERLVERLSELGLNTEASLDSQLGTLSWYSWVKRSQLKSYREEFYSSCRQLTGFIDDAMALMLCEGGHGNATDTPVRTAMFLEAHNIKRELDTVLMDRHATVGGMVEKLLSVSRRVSLDLRSA